MSIVQRPAAQVAPRYPLAMPPGSVRAILTFIVMGLVWALMLQPPERGTGIPFYLLYLMFLSLGGFFAAHGRSIAPSGAATSSPLYLPRGSLRALLILGFLAVLGWRYYVSGDIRAVLSMNLAQADPNAALLPLVLVAAFFLGVFVQRVVNVLAGSRGTPPWFQDIQAWVALLATFAMGIEAVIQGIINPGLPSEKRVTIPELQIFLAAVTGFYFGARS